VSAGGGGLERQQFLEALQAVTRLRRATLNLLITRQADTAAAEDTLRRVAFRFGVLIVFLTSLGMLVALGFHYRLSGLMIRPIVHIIRFVDNVGAGLFDQRLGTQRDHLINRLAQSCNRLTTNLQDAAEESRRRVRTERDTATVLIETFEEPVLVVTDGGDALLANAAARELFAGDGGRARMRAFQEAVRAKESSFSGDERTYMIKKIVGEGSGETLAFAVRIQPDPASVAES
jgi:nitrogen fixation/metabolism regulation signal transduction histidine kinase